MAGSNTAADSKSVQSDHRRNFGNVVSYDKKKRISNIEGMYSIFLIKKIEQAYSAEAATKAVSETILRDLSAFGGFCGSLVLK